MEATEMRPIDSTWLRVWEEPRKPPEVLYWFTGRKQPKIYEICLN